MSRAGGEPRTVAAIEGRVGRWGELKPRIVSALIMMAAALGTAFMGGVAFDLFWLAASIGVLWEWFRLLGGSRRVLRFVFGASVIAGASFLTSAGLPLYAIGLLLCGMVILAATAHSEARWLAAAGLAYAGALGVSVTLLRHSVPFGREAIVFLFAVVWGTDCMAYFGGRIVGGPKLAPHLSPSKTWSGFLVGVGSASIFGWAVAPSSACIGCMLLLGLAGGAVAQGGDLLESTIKRHFAVKDAGCLIPGHGGLMDRLDGFIAASLFAACLGAWRSGAAAAGAGLLQW